MIIERNMYNNKARVVAGYCWNWDKEGRSNSEVLDITIKEHDFEMSL